MGSSYDVFCQEKTSFATQILFSCTRNTKFCARYPTHAQEMHVSCARLLAHAQKIQDFVQGLLNFDLSVVNAPIKRNDDRQVLRSLLRKTKVRFVAEYALSGMQKLMRVAGDELVRSLPEVLEGRLLTVEEIEQGLAEELRAGDKG